MSAADDNMLTNITEVSIYPQKVWGQFNFGTTMILKAAPNSDTNSRRTQAPKHKRLKRKDSKRFNNVSSSQDSQGGKMVLKLNFVDKKKTH